MERLKANRKALRAAVSMTVNSAEKLLINDDATGIDLQSCKQKLIDKFDRLNIAQEAVSLQLNSDDDEKIFLEDFNTAEEYRDKVIGVLTRLDARISSSKTSGSPPPKLASVIKFPELKLQQFNGDPRGYLAFWAQFKKIHEDLNLAEEEKFSYLKQCMTVNSKAARLIDCFPPTQENYHKAISSLKERFGRSGLLIQIYIRDLLSLVMKNALPKSKIDLGELYDTIESKLLALESLGMNQETSVKFLEPMIESCLPESTLRAWERNKSRDPSRLDDSHSLEDLLKFIKSEVENEENIKLARTSFHTSKVHIKSAEEVSPSTSADLVNSTPELPKRKYREKYSCIFCEKPHDSKKCFQVNNLSINERHDVIKLKNACYKCLNIGHYASNCKLKLKCVRCNRGHCVLLCPRDAEELSNKNAPISNAASATVACDGVKGSAHCNVYLQTIIVKLINRGRILNARALLDSASQRSYISHKAIAILKLKPYVQQELVHTLFGGTTTRPVMHQVYEVMGMSTVDNFRCKLKLWSQETICGDLPKLNDPDIMRELNNQNIIIPDLNYSVDSIDLLLGADILGDLLKVNNDNFILKSGLHVVYTKFGYTLLGSPTNCSNNSSLLEIARGAANVAMSLFVQPCDVNELWELETLGIRDPIDSAKTKELQEDVREQFSRNLSRLSEGRFELLLPFKNDVRPFSNKAVIVKRHLKMCLKLKDTGSLHDYIRVFNEWESLNIIEKVPEEEIGKNGFYLPHRPVFKDVSATTKIRPVFDASVRYGKLPSLNDCLITGANLIEDIPDILDRFRLYPIGLAADVEKAYLQLSIHPSHRDFLRFFFPDEQGAIYRHRRVVFGLTSSPFMLAAVIRHLIDNAPEKYQGIARQMRHSFYVDNCVTGVFTVSEQILFIKNAIELTKQGRLNPQDQTNNSASQYVKLKTSSGITTRPIQRVYPLKVNSDHRSPLKEVVLNFPMTQKTDKPIVSVADPKVFFCGVFDPGGKFNRGEEDVECNNRKDKSSII